MPTYLPPKLRYSWGLQISNTPALKTKNKTKMDSRTNKKDTELNKTCEN